MRLFKRTTGTGFTHAGQGISFGIPGAADLWAIVRREKDGIGIHVEIEVKSGQAQLGKRQVCFRNMILQMGGRYIICRDPLITAAELEAIHNEGI